MKTIEEIEKKFEELCNQFREEGFTVKESLFVATLLTSFCIAYSAKGMSK